MQNDLILEGKKFISSRRAAQFCGYTQDYIGQLIRGRKVDARMVGRNWFVSEESLISYKAQVEEIQKQKSLSEGLSKQDVSPIENSVKTSIEDQSTGIVSASSSIEEKPKLISDEKSVPERVEGHEVSSEPEIYTKNSLVKKIAELPIEKNPSVSFLTFTTLGKKALVGALSLSLIAGSLWVVESKREKIAIDDTDRSSLAAIVTASADVPYSTLELIALGTYETLHPLFSGVGNIIARLFSDDVSNTLVITPKDDTPRVVSKNATTTGDAPVLDAIATLRAEMNTSFSKVFDGISSILGQSYRSSGSGERMLTNTSNVSTVTSLETTSQLASVYSILQAQINRLVATTTITTQNVRNARDANVTAKIVGSDISDSTITGSTFSGTNVSTDKLTVTGVSTTTILGSSLFDTDSLVIDAVNHRIGVGTTSPYEKLSVSGNLVADAIFGVSTSATSTFLGGFTLGTSGLVYEQATKNIGIGTTSPLATLDILQSANGTPLISAYRITDTAPTGDFINYRSRAGTTLFRVDNSGNLLAGGIINTGSQTVTSLTGPQFRVQYDGSNEITTSVSSTGTTTLAVSGTTPSLVFTPQANRVTSFQFTDATSIPVLSIDTQNRRVGISTTSPRATLHIDGTDGLIIPSGTTAQRAGSPYIGTVRYNTSTSQFEGYSGSTWGSLGGLIDVDQDTYVSAEDSPGTDNDQLKFFTFGSQRMIIGATGNVGIGTTSPFARLSVAGDAYIGGNLTATGTLTTVGAISAPYFVATDALATSTFAGGVTGPNNFVIQSSSGRVGIGTTSPYAKLAVNSFGGTQPQFVVASSTGSGATSTSFIVDTYGNSQFGGNLNFSADNIYDIGAGSRRPKSLYVGTSAVIGSGYPYGDALTLYTSGGGQNSGIYQNYTTSLAASHTLVNLFGKSTSGGGVTLTGNYAFLQSQSNQNSFNTGFSSDITRDASGGLDQFLSSIGFRSNFNVSGVGNYIASAAHLFAASPVLTSSGVITNLYGIYLNPQKISGVTNGYGIYQTGSSDINYFAGNVGIGTTSPSAKFAITAPATGNIVAIADSNNSNLMTVTQTGQINFADGGGTGANLRIRFPDAYGNEMGMYSDINNGIITRAQGHDVRLGANIGLSNTATGYIGWYSGASPVAAFFTDGSNIISQRNGTNEQAFRIYNTFTDASNYERGTQSWNGNILRIGTENSGSGSARDLAFITASTTRMTINATGNVGIGTTSPSQTFSVQGNALFSGNTTAANITATGTVTVPWGSATTPSIVFDAGGGSFGIYKDGAGFQFKGDGNNTAVTISTFSKSVVIGQANGTALDITGTSPAIKLYETSPNSDYASILLGSNKLSIIATSTGSWSRQDLHFNSNSLADGSAATIADSKLVIKGETGNIGISTTSPFARLSVAGDTYIGGNLTATGTAVLSSSVTINSSGVHLPSGYVYTNDPNNSYQPSTGTLNSYGGITTIRDSQFDRRILIDAQTYSIRAGTQGATMTYTAWDGGAGTAGADTIVRGGNAGTAGGAVAGNLYLRPGNQNGISGTPADVIFQGYTVASTPVLQEIGRWKGPSGNLGIGTTSPFARLSVAGDTYIGGNLTATGTLSANAFNVTGTGTTTFAGDILARGIAAWQYLTAPTIVATSTTGTSTFAGGITAPGNFVLQSSSGKIGLGTTGALLHRMTIGGGTQNIAFEFAPGVPGSGIGYDTSVDNGQGGIVFRANSGSSDFNTTVMTIGRNTPNVGIGTTSPFAKLSVTNTSANPSFLVEDSASPDSTPFVITEGGDVGIGTPTPTTKLHVIGTEGAYSTAPLLVSIVGNYLSNAKIAQFNFDNDVRNVRIHQVGLTAVIDSNGASDFSIGPNDAANLSLQTSGTAKLTVLSGGNVGLGTTSPFARLSVAGDTYIGGNLTATGTVNFTGASLSTGTTTMTNLVVTNTSTSTFAGSIDVNNTTANATSTIAANLWVKGTLRTGTGSLYMNDTSLTGGNGGFQLNTTGNSYVNAVSGNFGVGTTSPWAKLSINNSTNDIAGQPLFAIASSTANSTTTLFSITNTGQVLASDGSASAPAYSFSSEPTSGLYRNTTNQITVRIGGSTSVQFLQNQLRVPDGNLTNAPGIGFSGSNNNGFSLATVNEIATVISSNESIRYKVGIMQPHKGDTDAVSYAINARKSRGSAISPSVITTGDDLLTLSGYGYVGSTNQYVQAAGITIDSTGTISDSATGIGGIIRFNTRASGGAMTEALRIQGGATPQILAANGAATSPVYGFASDQTFGLYSPSAGVMNFASGGVDFVKFTNSPNTGYFNTGPNSFSSISTLATVNAFSNNNTALSTFRLSYANDTTSTKPTVVFTRSRGSFASPAAVVTGDDLTSISSYGYVGATNTFVEAANLTFDSTGTISDSSTGIGGIIRFNTRDTGGSLTERMTILNVGNVGIGTTTPGSLLSVSGTNNVSNFASANTTNSTTAFNFGESVAATNGDSTSGVPNQVLTRIGTLSGSTASPLSVYSRGSHVFSVSPTSRQIFNHSGSESAPTVSFTTANSSGLYASAGNEIGLSASGSTYVTVGGSSAPQFNVSALTMSAASHPNGISLSSDQSPMSAFWGNDSYAGVAIYRGATSGSLGAPLHFMRSAGSNYTYTNISDGYELMAIKAWGYMNQWVPATEIRSEVEGVSGSSIGGRLTFYTKTSADGFTSLTERMRINGSGNVGIGTTSPTRKLTVTGTVGALDDGGNPFFQTGDTVNDNMYMQWISASNYGLIQTQQGGVATGNLVLQSTGGNVGIGTTLPTTKLHIAGSGAVLRLQDTASASTSNSVAGYLHLVDSGGYEYGYFGDGSGGANNIQIYAGTTHALQFYSGGALAQTITTGGNVGIGTTSPTVNLSVSSSGAAQQRLTGGTNRQSVLIFDNNTAGFAIAHDVFDVGVHNFGIYDRVNGASRLLIDNTGNVGIGTTTPQSKLHVGNGGVIRLSTSGDTTSGCFRQNGVTLEYSNDCTTFNSFSAAAAGGWTDDGAVVRLTTGTDSVGIGTTSPSGKLHVYASSGDVATVIDGVAGTLRDLRFSTANSARWLLRIDNTAESGGNVGSDFNIVRRDDSAGDLGSALFIKRSTGNVGISTTTPAYKLEVVDTTAGFIGATTFGSNSAFIGTRINGTVSSPTQVLANQVITGMYSSAYGTGDTSRIYNALVGMHTAEDQTSTAKGSYITFNTTNLGTTIRSEKMRVDASGNVGIGTTTPSTLLTLAGANKFLTIDNTSTGNGGILFSLSGATKSFVGVPGSTDSFTPGSVAGDLVFRGNTQKILFTTDGGASTAMAVTTTGNVGIGTTSPIDVLHVSTNANTSKGVVVENLNNGSSAYSTISFYNDVGSSNRSFIAKMGSGNSGYNGANGFILGNITALPVSVVTNNVVRMTVDGSGNVGIGTTNPQAKLHVEGASGITSFTGTSALGATIRGSASTNDYSGIDFSISTAAPRARIASYYASAGSYLQFGTSNNYASGITNTAMTIDPSGNVGIGTTSPQSILNLYTSAPGIQLSPSGYGGVSYSTFLGSKSDAEGVLQLGNNGLNSIVAGNTATGGFLRFVVNNTNTFPTSANGTEAMRITASGDIGIGTSTPQGRLAITGAANSYGTLSVVSGTGNSTDLSFGVYGDGGPVQTPTFAIQRGGNVGIGTTTPSVKLHVAGTDNNGILIDAATVPSLKLQRTNSTSGTGNIDWLGSTGATGARIGVNDSVAGSMEFKLGGSASTDTKLIILSNGAIGIGTTTQISSGMLSVAYAPGSTGGMGFRPNTDSNTPTPIAFLNAAGTSVGTITTNGSNTAYNTSSDIRLKGDITDLTNAGYVIDSVQPRIYTWLSDGSQGVGFVAQELFTVVPEAVSVGSAVTIASTSPDFRPWAIDFSKLVPYLVADAKATRQKIGLSDAPTTTPSLYIDASGNIGIGTTTPAYKLHVLGDVAAQSFVNISTRSSKKDIEYLDDTEKTSILERIRTVGVATYKYTDETESDSTHLGLIAEEAPVEVLATGGKGVDIYKLSTFILAGVQEQQNQIEALQARFASLDTTVANLALSVASTTAELTLRLDATASLVASLLAQASSTTSTTPTETTQTIVWSSDLGTQILSFFQSVGLRIENGIAYVQGIVSDTVTTKRLTVGDSANLAAAGVTILDRATGQPACIYIENSIVRSEGGACGSLPVATSDGSPTVPVVITDPVPTPIVDETATSTTDTVVGDTATSTSATDTTDTAGTTESAETQGNTDTSVTTQTTETTDTTGNIDTPASEPTPEPVSEPAPEPTPEVTATP